MKRHGQVQTITTDGLRSYKVALEDPAGEYRNARGAGPTAIGAIGSAWIE